MFESGGEGKRSRLRDWGIVLVALADDIGALVLVFIVLWFFGIQISLPILILLVVVLGGVIFIVHRAIIHSLHARKTTGAEGMVGAIGEVVAPLQPSGVVRVAGEYWTAKSIAEDIGKGEEVEVIGLQNLVLQVRRKG
ncbi:NfeD family protein [Chloroflexota bacterium]